MRNATLHYLASIFFVILTVQTLVLENEKNHKTESEYQQKNNHTSQELTGTSFNSGMDKKIEKKKWTPLRIALLAGGGIFIFLTFYNIFWGDRASKLNVDRDKITIGVVANGGFQEFIPVSGSILPLQTIVLDAVEGGRVETKYIEAGTVVKKGDPIIKLSNTSLQLDVMYREALLFEQLNNARNTKIVVEQNSISIKSALAEAVYNYDRTEKAFVRDSVLLAKSLISQLDFTQTKNEFHYWVKKRELAFENFQQDSLLKSFQISQLDESVKRIQTNLDMVQGSLNNLIIRAPIGGELTSLNAEVGQSKSNGERIGQIDVLDGFKLQAPIDEFYLARISPGLHAEADVAGTTYSLIVKKVYPEVKDGKFDVDLLFSGKTPDGIRRGQTLQLRLELGDLTQATLLPRGGFFQKTGGQWVYVIDPSENFATKRAIKLGRQNPQVFEVIEGLKPGEKVVTSSYDNFGDNDKLILKN